MAASGTNSSIKSADAAAAADRKYKQQEGLIAKARAEYVKKTMPSSKLTASGDIISDPNDPKFDLEAFLKIKEAESATH